MSLSFTLPLYFYSILILSSCSLIADKDTNEAVRDRALKAMNSGKYAEAVAILEKSNINQNLIELKDELTGDDDRVDGADVIEFINKR